jgi:hypothetical protein
MPAIVRAVIEASVRMQYGSSLICSPNHCVDMDCVAYIFVSTGKHGLLLKNII